MRKLFLKNQLHVVTYYKKYLYVVVWGQTISDPSPHSKHYTPYPVPLFQKPISFLKSILKNFFKKQVLFYKVIHLFMFITLFVYVVFILYCFIFLFFFCGISYLYLFYINCEPCFYRFIFVFVRVFLYYYIVLIQNVYKLLK